jgi:hypothetical protein
VGWVTAPAIPTPSVTRRSLLGIFSVVLGALNLLGYFVIRVISAIPDSFDQLASVAPVLGILGFLTIIPIAASIVLGHLGLTATRTGRRGRATAGIGLGIGYTLLALYFIRLVASIEQIGQSDLASNFFWWS